MAELTTNDGVFGTKGTSCPITICKMVDISRTVDFDVSPVAENKNYKMMAIPKGFLAMYIAVEQLGKVAETAADVDLTFKLKSDETQIGGTFSLDYEASAHTYTPLRKCDPVIIESCVDGEETHVINTTIPKTKFFSAGDTLCVCVPDGLANDKMSGKMRVHLLGYQTFGESLGDVAAGTPAWTTGQSDADAAANKSGGDPMFH